MTVDYDKFHNTELTENVTHAYQALAIHELRRPFKPVFWTKKGLFFSNGPTGLVCRCSRECRRRLRTRRPLQLCARLVSVQCNGSGLELDLDYLNGEISRQNFNENIALSRYIGHGKPGLINRRKLFCGVLERPFEHNSINAFLSRWFPNQKMEADVFEQMLVHWSTRDRLRHFPEYNYDKESFSKLDGLSRNLPVVGREVTLNTTQAQMPESVDRDGRSA